MKRVLLICAFVLIALLMAGTGSSSTCKGRLIAAGVGHARCSAALARAGVNPVFCTPRPVVCVDIQSYEHKRPPHHSNQHRRNHGRKSR